MKKLLRLSFASLLALTAGALANIASAQVTTFYSSSPTCAPAITTQSYTGTTPVTVHLCGNIPAGSFYCGNTLQMIAPANGLFVIATRTTPAPFNAAPYAEASVIANEPVTTTGTADLGVNLALAGTAATGGQRLLATLSIAPTAAATASPYLLSYSAVSTIAVDATSGACQAPADNAVSATLSMTTPPTIAIARNNASVADNGTAITYTVTATPAQAITVNLTSGVVGTMSGVTNTCAATITTSGAGTATCAISATNTVAFDGPATATVTIGAATTTPYNGAGNSVNGTITNDDLPTVTVTPPTASVNETGATSTNVTFTLSTAAPTGGFVVPITMTGATSRVSGTCSAATVTIAAGQTSNTCSVQAIDNAIADGTQTVTVASNCTSTCTNAAAAGSSVVSVLDNDQPTINVTCAASTLADNGATTACTFRNSLAIGAAGFSVPFTFTSDNARHTVAGCTSPITVAANTGANTVLATCTVTAVANTIVGDGADAVTFTVTGGAGYSAGLPATVAITDDDFSTISVAVLPATVTENSGTPLTFTFTATPVSTSATTVLFSLPANAARYTIGGAAGCAAGSVVLAANTASFTCTATPVNTLVVDGNVSVIVTVTPNASYTVAASPGNTATGTITDDDVTVTVTPSSAIEGSAVTFSIACTGPAGVSVTGLSFGVTPAQDAGAAPATPAMAGPIGTLTCGTPLLVTVPTFNDVVIGNARSLSLALSGAPAASNSGTVVLPAAAAVAAVIDNDQPLIVPTMSAAGLGMLALLIFGFAAFGQRRRVD